jgi:type 1 fimbriae regulatory protein FimB/type 1 fimbriae regulatory protein FimE
MAKKATGPPRRKKNTDYRGREHLDEMEVDELRKAAAQLGRHGERDSTMILIAFHHALRCSELVRLRWDRVYLEKEDIWIVRCKGSKSGMHPLYPDDLKALRKLGPDKKGWVFKSESKLEPGAVSESGFQKIVARAGELAGFDFPVHPHMLRHACGYWMHKEGHDIRTIQEWMGHVSIQNTQLYTALDTDHFRRVGIGKKKGAS